MAKFEEKRQCGRCSFSYPVSKYKCPKCGAWYVAQAELLGVGEDDGTYLLSSIPEDSLVRIPTGPWDAAFSDKGGLVTVSTTLLGGEPGAGKSTLAAQLLDAVISHTKKEGLYVHAEEAATQLRDRVRRLDIKNLELYRAYPATAKTNLGIVIERRRPCCVIIDSIPKFVPDIDASVEFAKRLKDYAMQFEIPMILIDHVNKDGQFAGLMALQHEVDTTMAISQVDNIRRVLTVTKNRFGPDRYIPLEMHESGLKLGKFEDEEDEESDPDWEENDND